MEIEKKHIDMAKKRRKCELALKNCRIVNTYWGGIEDGDIAIADGIVVGVGDYSGETEVDCGGAYACPGLIDGHMHIESTMLTPAHYAAAVLPCGVTTAIADPHEIANVCGIAGVDYMIAEAEGLPMDIRFMLPSCVPATPFEHNGACVGSAEVRENIGRADVFGLGEMMNYPGVCAGDPEVLAKLAAARACGKPVDGHYTGDDGADVNVYALCGIGNDHESTRPEEAEAKLKRGLYVQLREGSASRNLAGLLPAVTPRTLRRVLFCTDDKHADDILERGHLDNNVRLAVRAGLDPVDAITIATLNAAECYGLKDRGAIAPGKRADILLADDLDDFRVKAVYRAGKKVAENGRALFTPRTLFDERVRNTMRAAAISPQALEIRLSGRRAKIIRLLPDSVVTACETAEVNVREGKYQPTEGVCKACVVERHRNSGNVGLGLIAGYGLRNGAVALSVAHDSHNIIACGDSDVDIALAVNEIIARGGGLTLVENGRVFGTLELEIAGLMSGRGIGYVAEGLRRLNAKARSMGVPGGIDPFMSLSFLSLVVIPELKLTDQGLFDVAAFGFTTIQPESGG